MLDLRTAKRIAIIGGETAGWFAALTFRRIFGPKTEILVLEDPDKETTGMDEGGVLNLTAALNRNGIDVDEFVAATGATYKLGFAYEGWRNGGPEDIFYHLYPMPGEQVAEIDRAVMGFSPLLAARVAAGADMASFFPGVSLIRDSVSQQAVRAVLATKRSGLAPSWHFDTGRAARYLCHKAVARGVVSRVVRVDKLLLHERGQVHALVAGGEEIPVDFVIDASGWRRLGIGETCGEKWRSFSQYLPLDRILPFHLPHSLPEPELLTSAIALKSGWMWTLPLQERISAGAVFSSVYTDAQTVQREIEARLRQAISPARPIRFEPGHFETVWRNNVVGLGLAAGFVEPLAATTIGQMLESLRNIERVLTDGGGIIGHQAIFSFNRSHYKSWDNIRDFLRMHYDGGRSDTPFWQAVGQLPRSPQYTEIKRTFARRLPRAVDLESYIGYGWGTMFHMINWLMIAQPLGVLTRQAGVADLSLLPQDIRQTVFPYLEALQEDLKNKQDKLKAAS